MVLALALPHDFPHRQFLINVVFGVVVISILVQGVTMGPLLKKMGIVSEPAERLRFERARADGLAVRAVLNELDAVAITQVTTPQIVAALRAEYEARLVAANEQIAALHLSDTVLAEEELQRLQRHLIVVEKERIMHAVAEGLSSEEAAADLLAQLDTRQAQLEDTHDTAVD